MAFNCQLEGSVQLLVGSRFLDELELELGGNGPGLDFLGGLKDGVCI